MSEENQGLTLNGFTGRHSLLMLFSFGIIGVTIYLLKHYFQVHFPEGFHTGHSALCDVSSFWNCDAATYSPIAAVANIPIAFFGMMVGLSFLLGSFFPSKEWEKTNTMISIINAFGCAALGLYSLISLGSLCPMCTAYYLLSFGCAFLYIKFGVPGFGVKAKYIGIILAPIIIGGVILNQTISDKKKIDSNRAVQLYEQFSKLNEVGDPAIESEYRLASASEKFVDAPVRLTIYSDFQCPFCARSAKMFESLIRQFRGKMNFQYFPYPLDNDCNPKIEKEMHPAACKATYYTFCVPRDEFAQAHDYLFEEQAKLDHKWINQLAKDKKIEDCVNDPKTKTKVQEYLATAEKYNVKGTPTFILNGKKIEAALTPAQWIGLFNKIIEAAK